TVGRYHVCSPAGQRVTDVIDFDAQPAQAGQRVRAHPSVVLADAGGEHHGVGVSQHRQVRADVVPDAMAVDLAGEQGVLVALTGSPVHLAHVVGTGQAE